MTFAQALALVKRKRAMTYDELAGLLGFCRPQVVFLTTGKRRVTPTILGHIYRNRFLNEQERELLLLAGGWKGAR